jgi:hypothetical protein
MERLAIGFTGTREGMSDLQKQAVHDLLKPLPVHAVHHGDCIGADKDFHDAVDYLRKVEGKKMEIVIHPPENDSYRAFCKGDLTYHAKPYLERNHDIVDCSDMMIATPREKEEQLRSGTWATIRYTRKKKVKLYIIYKDGEVVCSE